MHGAPAAQNRGISENAAALLSYVLGWLTGLIFLLIDKRPYVRFHAAQSLVLFGGLHILRAALGVAFGLGWWYAGGFGITGAEVSSCFLQLGFLALSSGLFA